MYGWKKNKKIGHILICSDLIKERCYRSKYNFIIKISQVNQIAKSWIYQKDLKSLFIKRIAKEREHLTQKPATIIISKMQQTGRETYYYSKAVLITKDKD